MKQSQGPVWRTVLPFLASLPHRERRARFLARAATAYYVTVAGLGGEPDYEQRFTAMAKDLDKSFKNFGERRARLRCTGGQATRAHLTETLGPRLQARLLKADDDFVLVLIGHGSFDGAEYKFNLVGPDITGSDLAALCDRIASKRQLIVNTTSASGGSIAALEKPGRAVIAATKSGTEKNATVFARYFAEALQDPTTDTEQGRPDQRARSFSIRREKDGGLFTNRKKRLATEHAVFEDTGQERTGTRGVDRDG